MAGVRVVANVLWEHRAQQHFHLLGINIGGLTHTPLLHSKSLRHLEFKKKNETRVVIVLKGPRSVLSANAMIATNGCDIWSVWPREHKPVSCAGACRPSFDGRRRSSAAWLREAATKSTQEAWGDGSLFVGYTYSSVADSYETELGTFVSVVIKCWG